MKKIQKRKYLLILISGLLLISVSISQAGTVRGALPWAIETKPPTAPTAPQPTPQNITANETYPWAVSVFRNISQIPEEEKAVLAITPFVIVGVIIVAVIAISIFSARGRTAASQRETQWRAERAAKWRATKAGVSSRITKVFKRKRR